MPRARDTGQKTLFFETIQRLDLRGLFRCGRLRRHNLIWSLKKDAGMSRLHHRVSEIQPEMRDLQAEDMLLLRCETGQVVSKRLARFEVVLSDVSHRNSRAYDRREEQRTVTGTVDLR